MSYLRVDPGQPKGLSLQGLQVLLLSRNMQPAQRSLARRSLHSRHGLEEQWHTTAWRLSNLVALESQGSIGAQRRFKVGGFETDTPLFGVWRCLCLGAAALLLSAQTCRHFGCKPSLPTESRTAGDGTNGSVGAP